MVGDGGMNSPIIVYICHPYARDPDSNRESTATICRRAVRAGCLPLAPQLYLPQFINETAERKLAMAMCLKLVSMADELRVYYGAAVTEAASFKDRHVFVVGGANSAGQGALFLSRYASQVTILLRGSSLTKGMSQYLIDQIDNTANIIVRTKIEVQEVLGESKLESLALKIKGEEVLEAVSTAALFIFIGAVPRTEWLGDQIARSSHGFILSGTDISKNGNATLAAKLNRTPYMLETNMPGVFVAGDVRFGSVKRVASAVGEGSMAVMYIHRYLNSV